MTASRVQLEDVIKDIGGCGRFQTILSVIIHSMKCIVCFSMLAMVFCGAVPDWWCVDDLIGQNGSDVIRNRSLSQFKSCKSGNGSQTCSNFLYDGSIRTVVTEWDLLCDKAWIPQTITSIQMAGVLAGNLLAGQIADLIGRKPPVFLSQAALVGLNIIAAYSTGWLMFTILRFFLGFAVGVFITVMYNIQAEFTLARWRTWIVHVPSWPLCTALFALVCWLIKDWQYVHIASACVGAPLLLSLWFVPESLRWYVSHNRNEDAEKVVQFIGKVNGYGDVNKDMLHEVTEAEKAILEEHLADKKYSFLDIFKHRHILKFTLLLAWIWTSLGLMSYGIQFGIQKLSGDLYLNIFMIGIIWAPLQFVNIYLCNRFGRKKTAVIFFSTSSVGAVLVGIFQYIQFDNEDTKGLLTNIFAITSLLLIYAGWSPIQTLTIELYPTVVRNIGYGSQNTMSRVGAIIGPQLVTLDTLVPGVMYFICAACGFLSMLFMYPLPETKDAVLVDIISKWKTFKEDLNRAV